MWHILDSDEFEELRTLSNDYDRKEWQRKFWKSNDPTPTTEKNELKEEFERRVKYSRKHFSEPWNARNFRYLPDEHIRSGWFSAPWDARGELYIKYGEPDVRSVQGFHTEEWVFYRYGVDFIVKQYMTNIYGNAINAGSITRGIHSNQNFPYPYNYNYVYPFLNRDQQEYLDWNTYNTYLDANFVYKNEIRYEHKYDADPISDFELEITSDDSLISMIYRIPASEFKLQESGNTYNLSYLEKYSILDEDMREVASGEITKQINDISDEDSPILRKIEVNLPPGIYRISIQIKDKNSKKLGIYTQMYTAK
jgi:GWxTD domain-containing protein